MFVNERTSVVVSEFVETNKVHDFQVLMHDYACLLKCLCLLSTTETPYELTAHSS